MIGNLHRAEELHPKLVHPVTALGQSWKREHAAGIVSGDWERGPRSTSLYSQPCTFPGPGKSSRSTGYQLPASHQKLPMAPCRVPGLVLPPSPSSAQGRGGGPKTEDISRLRAEAWYLLHGLGPW